MVENISAIEEKILDFLQANPRVSSKDIHEGIGETTSYSSVKRLLQSLIAHKFIDTLGSGKGTKYFIGQSAALLRPINPDLYFKKEIDERVIQQGFNHELIQNLALQDQLFTTGENEKLRNLQSVFEQHIANLTPEQYKTEFERLAIDLSWKSSQIEGNTYSLLETELLLREQQTANGKTQAEAIMILNHKAALDFILEHPDYTNPLTISGIEDIHSLLIKGLNVSRNLRQRRVGISGTNYRPLDSIYQIREALEDMCRLINRKANVFEKALLALLLISYIQPFEDGNKLTARILSNAILINHNHCPLSFRTVDSIDYKKAMLIFYEQNNISVFKEMFIEQYEFAVKTYF